MGAQREPGRARLYSETADTEARSGMCQTFRRQLGAEQVEQGGKECEGSEWLCIIRNQKVAGKTFILTLREMGMA